MIPKRDSPDVNRNDNSADKVLEHLDITDRLFLLEKKNSKVES